VVRRSQRNEEAARQQADLELKVAARAALNKVKAQEYQEAMRQEMQKKFEDRFGKKANQNTVLPADDLVKEVASYNHKKELAISSMKDKPLGPKGDTMGPKADPWAIIYTLRQQGVDAATLEKVKAMLNK